jgi:hypothetical protein
MARAAAHHKQQQQAAASSRAPQSGAAPARVKREGEAGGEAVAGAQVSPVTGRDAGAYDVIDLLSSQEDVGPGPGCHDGCRDVASPPGPGTALGLGRDGTGAAAAQAAVAAAAAAAAGGEAAAAAQLAAAAAGQGPHATLNGKGGAAQPPCGASGDAAAGPDAQEAEEAAPAPAAAADAAAAEAAARQAARGWASRLRRTVEHGRSASASPSKGLGGPATGDEASADP